MERDLSGVEVPRLVKKPGEHKRVDTLKDLQAALADGWVLRLPDVPIPDVLDDPDGVPPSVNEADELDAEPSERPHKGGKKK